MDVKRSSRGRPRAAALALLLAGAAAVVAGAGEGGGKGKGGKIDPNGEPAGFRRGESVRYAVWHDKNGWHLRTTTAKVEHVFKGRITVEVGRFEKVQSVHLEKTGKLSDRWKLTEPERNEITFDFKTDQGIDGINFHVSKGAARLHFNLRIDGKHEPERIFIGHNNEHPRKDPFTLPAHPNKK